MVEWEGTREIIKVEMVELEWQVLPVVVLKLFRRLFLAQELVAEELEEEEEVTDLVEVEDGLEEEVVEDGTLLEEVEVVQVEV